MVETSGGTTDEDTERGSTEAHPETLRLTLHTRLQQG